jgi:hypothetical protein
MIPEGWLKKSNSLSLSKEKELLKGDSQNKWPGLSF